MFRRPASLPVASFALCAIALLAGSSTANAANISFTGSFTQDDNVQLFNFVVGAPSNVTLRTWSYAGGTNAAGQLIARGGFDPILALFDSTGLKINENDDGGSALVASDALTGRAWDTFLTAMLNPGTYTVSVMEYDNFSAGANLSNGFTRTGQGNFTSSFSSGPATGGSFRDVSGVNPGAQRNANWAFDILNVQSAVIVPPTTIPEPSSLLLLSAGLATFAFAKRRRRS